MRVATLPWFLMIAMFAVCCLVEPLFAQAQREESTCRVDEVDMGGYCASLPPAHTQAEKDKRRITRFRGVGMMPGRADGKSSQASPSSGAVPPPLDLVINSGFGVQLGAYASKQTALSVVLSLESRGNPVLLARLERGDQILWACILGPYPDKQSAQVARDRIRLDERFRSAWVRPLKSLVLEGLTSESTEE